MPELTEKAVLSDAVKWEANPNYCRSNVTIASGSNIALLEVVGQVTADGKYEALDPAAATGVEVAAGVSLLAVDATAADSVGLILNGDSMVDMDELVWPDGISAGDKATAISQLKAINIKAVETTA
jgi:Bacteriophage lambda head decoration protein D